MTESHDGPDGASGGYQDPGQTPSSVAGSTGGDGPIPSGVTLSEEARPRPKRTGLLIGGLAAVVALGGGGVFAATQLSGGGARPADVMPADTFAYFQVDIDPSAGQKVAAVRFLNKLPQVRDFESGDFRKKLWDLASQDADNDCVNKFDYDRDIAPWLGDRFGVGLRPGTGDSPKVVAALQAKDTDAAVKTITELTACGAEQDEPIDVVAHDGYVLFTNKGDGQAVLDAVDQETLADSATFKGDMDALGEQGVVAAWVDAAAAASKAGQLPGIVDSRVLRDQAAGRIAAAIRFDPGYIEIAGIGRGIPNVTRTDTNGDELRTLPEDTVAALQLSGADRLIDAAWPRMKQAIDDEAAKNGQDDPLPLIEQELGIALPDDLKVLLGSSLTVAVPDQDFSADEPQVGAKAATSDASRADAVLGKLEDLSGGEFRIERRIDGDRLLVGTSADYVDRLAQGGKLGDSDGFTAAIGDTSDTALAAFVDLDRIEKLYLDEIDGEARAVVEALKAVGLNTSIPGDGEVAFSLRVVSN